MKKILNSLSLIFFQYNLLIIFVNITFASLHSISNICKKKNKIYVKCTISKRLKISSLSCVRPWKTMAGIAGCIAKSRKRNKRRGRLKQKRGLVKTGWEVGRGEGERNGEGGTSRYLRMVARDEERAEGKFSLVDDVVAYILWTSCDLIRITMQENTYIYYYVRK